MNLIISELKLTVQECERNKKYLHREAEQIREERKCYERIKGILGVIDDEENNTVRQDT